MSASTPDDAAGLDPQQARLVRMANQICENAPVRDAAAGHVAQHLRSFWTPQMRSTLATIAERQPTLLRPQVLAALEMLA